VGHLGLLLGEASPRTALWDNTSKQQQQQQQQQQPKHDINDETERDEAERDETKPNKPKPTQTKRLGTALDCSGTGAIFTLRCHLIVVVYFSVLRLSPRSCACKLSKMKGGEGQEEEDQPNAPKKCSFGLEEENDPNHPNS
jgi:hypothetical protein